MAVTGVLKEQFEGQLTALTDQQKSLLASVEPLHAQRQALLDQIQPLEAQLREVNAKIKEAEAPLRDIGNGIAAIHRALGARTLTNEGQDAKPEA